MSFGSAAMINPRWQPIECPTTKARSVSVASRTATASAAYSASVYASGSSGRSDRPFPRPSIVIDYTKGSEIEGYRPVPDKLAGPEGLSIRDEIRLLQPNFYLGRMYWDRQPLMNFTLQFD